MAKVKEDKSRVTLEIDGKQAVNQLGKLEMEAKQLAIELKQAKKGTQEYVDTNKKLKATEAQIKELRQQLGLTGMTMTQLSRYQRDLRKEIQNTTTAGTARYRELNTELQRVNRTLAQQRAELNGTKGFFSDIKKELKSFAVLAVGALGVSEFYSGIQNLISGSADLSDQISDVQKTTQLTKTEMQELMQEFKGFNTRTPRAELLKLADEAGKMGFRGVKAISEYVKQTNELTVALGQDLGEDAGLKVAKMAERFNVSMTQIGSGINSVADNTKAQAGFITEFLSRLAGAGNELGISAGDILGYAAAIDEMGLNVEMSSTALNGFLIDFTKNTEKFGRVAGFAEGELSKLVGEQGTNEGFLAFLKRLRETNPVAADFLRKLEEIGINGDRGSQVFLALSQNVDQLRSRQALANNEIAKGTSLTDEYNKKNENFAGNLEKIQKWMAGWFVNGGVMDALNSFVSKWAEWISIPISRKMEEERIKLNSLHAQILTTNTGSEERITLIKQLQDLAPATLGHLDAETVSNQELSAAVAEANEHLVNRIIIQSKQEEIDKNIQDRAEKKMDVLDQEQKVREMMIKIAEKYNIQIKEANSLEEQAIQVYDEARAIQEKTTQVRGRLFDSVTEYSFQIGQMQKKQESLNTMDNYGNRLLEEKNKLMQQLGVTMSTTPKTSNPIQSAGTPEAPVVPGSTGSATEAQVQRFAQGMEDIWAKIREKTTLEKQAMVQDASWAFDEVIKLGEQFGIDLNDQANQRREQGKRWAEQMLQDERDMAQAKLSINESLSFAIGAAIDLVGNKSGELTAFQKILALAQIGLDTASAIMKAEAISLQTGMAAGPAGPLVYKATKISIIGSILSAAAKAKNVLFDSNVPEYTGTTPTRSTRSNVQQAPKKSFYYGGWTGSQGMGAGDEFGEFAGSVHLKEYVIPSMTVSDPYVADLLPAIEQIRLDNIRGFSSMGKGQMGDPETKALLKVIAKAVQAFPKEIKGKWVISELEEAQEEKDYLEKRYAAN